MPFLAFGREMHVFLRDPAIRCLDDRQIPPDDPLESTGLISAVEIVVQLQPFGLDRPMHRVSLGCVDALDEDSNSWRAKLLLEKAAHGMRLAANELKV